MFGKKKPEVLVVGAGPVGLFAALVLARRQVRVQVVDKAWRSGSRSYALALHPQSLALLQEVGLLERVLSQAQCLSAVGFYEGAERRATLDLSVLETPFPFLAVVQQEKLEALLVEALKEEGVKVQWNHEASVLMPRGDHAEVTIAKLEQDSVGYAVAHSEWVIARSRTVQVPFVIGADGHRSDVRRALGIAFTEVAPAKHFAVFEFKTEAALPQEMRVVLTEDTTNVLWPLPDGSCRWSFELPGYTVPASSRTKDRFALQHTYPSYPQLDEAHLRAFIAERAPWFEGRIDEMRWQIVVRFEHRLASTFGRQRMWLAGDAGHMAGPVGVQSMNVGLREASDLAEILAGHLQDGLALTRLEEYGRERLAEWRHLLGLQGATEPDVQMPAWLRRHHMRLLPCLPASGAHLAALAHQVGLETQVPASPTLDLASP